MDRWLIILIVIIVIVVLSILIFNALCHELIFVPPKSSRAQNQKVQHIDDQVAVVEYLPASNGSIEPDQAVVYSHGNATDIRELHPFFQTLASELQAKVYAYEYPGYSYHQDQLPSGPGCVQNLQTTLNWLIREKGYTQSQITLIGRSLGSGPTVQVAKKYPKLGSIVLISAYKSLPRVVYDSMFSELIVPSAHLFRSYDDIHEIRSPITFVHGKEDGLISASHSEDMYRERQSSKDTLHFRDRLTILEGEGHNMKAGKTILVLKQTLAKQGKLPKIEEVSETEMPEVPYVSPGPQTARLPGLGLK